MQGNLITFPNSKGPNYQGRVLALNMERATRFQCGGFFVGSKSPIAMVPVEAQMDQIHRAIEAGVLLDVTDSEKGIRHGGTVVGAVTEEITRKKVYISFVPGGTASGINMPAVITAAEGTDDPAVQAKMDAALAAGRPLIQLAPGMDNPDKYLLRTIEPVIEKVET